MSGDDLSVKKMSGRKLKRDEGGEMSIMKTKNVDIKVKEMTREEIN